MEKRPGWFSSAFKLKCAKCRTGRMFVPVQKFNDWFTMNDHCPTCGTHLYMEPGFYWGAMYVSYIISSGMCFLLFFLGYFGFGWTLTGSFAFLSIIVMLTAPYVFRLALSFWLDAFMRYDPNILNKTKES